ncbi:MAG TPA: flagellar assembly protein FliW [archaeon]|nr:flagellar assembly protein FliW [archaeon]
MKVNSTRFGTIEVKKKDILTFPEGLVGFAACKRFFIYNKEQNMPFFWLHSMDDPKIAFVICDPLIFFPDYKVSVRKEELSILNINDQADLITCSIISISHNPFRMTANLQGPLVINTKNRLGKQLVLVDGNYTTRHMIMVKKESSNVTQGVFIPRNKPIEVGAGNSLVLT